MGTVYDQSNAVVPKAKVTLLNEATSSVRQSVANDAGHFAFPAVAPGNYTVKIEIPNFKTWEKTGVVMNSGDTRDIEDIHLTVGSTDQVVSVESVLGAVTPETSGERSELLTAKDIENIALVGRNLSELLKVLPGVTTTPNGKSNGTGFNFTDASASSSAVGVGLSANGAPYRGGTALLLDGANILDPGCQCWGTAVINSEMTSEVKVQTSNFGADVTKGPIVVNATSKYGTSTYHGAAYLDARNTPFAANTWANKDYADPTKLLPRQDSSYYYPGGSFGGPVPGTHGKLLTWTGYEYFWQKLPSVTPLTSYVPTDDMKAGNFGNTAANNALCSTYDATKVTNWCATVNGGFAPNGTVITGNSVSAYIDPGATALMKLWPSANVDPATTGGYNYYLPITTQHNGYLFRQRLDYNLTENDKFFASYQYGTDTSITPAHMWWNPSNSVEYPGGGMSQITKTDTLSANYVHVFSPTLTNEIVGTWVLYNSPLAPSNLAASYRSTIDYPYGTIFGNGAKVAPGIYSPGAQTFPELSQYDAFETGSYPSQKTAYTLSDNLSKAYKNHTFKAGFYFEKVGNLQGSTAYPNGIFTFASGSKADAITGTTIGTINPVANFLMGISKTYSEVNKAPISDMDYKTTSFYAMDDWKFNRRLTINLGARFEHLGRWYDNNYQGLATWLPGRYTSDLTLGKSFPGSSWHGIEPGISLSASSMPLLTVSPRFGFALDVFGTGKTVLRGGWGMYRWEDQFNDYTNMLSPGQNQLSYSSPSNKYITMAEIGALAGSQANATAAWSPSNLYAVDPNDNKVGLTQSYSFTVSQQVPWKSLLEVAYVGNSTSNLLMGGQSDGSGISGNDFMNVNKMPKGASYSESANVASYVPYSTGYSSDYIRVPEHLGYANYNGLQFSWLKQSARANFNVNYTFSKSLGIVGSTVDPYSVHGNYGVLSIDRTHVFSASYSYNIGKMYRGGTRFLGSVTNDWTISGTSTYQAGGNLQALSGQNFGMALTDTASNPITTLSYFGTNVGEVLPVYTCDPRKGLHDHQYINATCIAPPTIGSQGSRQLPYMRGPAYFNSDLSLFKDFHVREKQTVQFRASAFNFLNHPLWAFASNSNRLGLTYQENGSGGWTPTSATATPTQFGEADTKVGQRIVQLGVKYTF
jgi:hypothetical protein